MHVVNVHEKFMEYHITEYFEVRSINLPSRLYVVFTYHSLEIENSCGAPLWESNHAVLEIEYIMKEVVPKENEFFFFLR